MPKLIRAVGAGSAISSFLTFGMGPLATSPPPAHAFDDDFGLADLSGNVFGAAAEPGGFDIPTGDNLTTLATWYYDDF